MNIFSYAGLITARRTIKAALLIRYYLTRDPETIFLLVRL